MTGEYVRYHEKHEKFKQECIELKKMHIKLDRKIQQKQIEIDLLKGDLMDDITKDNPSLMGLN